MAERDLSVRLVVSGEKEYRDAMKQASAELKTLQSELKKVTSEFEGQENTIDALEAKNKALNDILSKQTEILEKEQAAIKSNRDLQEKYAQAADEARQKLDRLNAETDEGVTNTKQHQKAIADATAEIAKYDKATLNAALAAERHTQAGNRAEIAINKLNAELKQNDKYLDEARASADGAATSIDRYGKEVKEATNSSEQLGQKGKESIDALSQALVAGGVIYGIQQIAEAMWSAVEASVDFESAMAGVAKTTDLTDVELAEMGEEFKELSTVIPSAAKDFASIAEIAGQLGVAKENLVDFSTTMSMLATATTMTAEESASMLVQFTNVTGMDASFYSNLGSTIVDLGNNFATTEQKILEMAQTLAGAGTNAGLSEQQILALATAVTSLGIEAATGGTNMSMLIGDMQLAVETGEDLEEWAYAAGMSALEFSRLWGQDAGAAIQTFIGNLDNLDESQLSMLKNLGVVEQRTLRMVTSLVNAEEATGLLTDAFNTSNTAWSENTALVAEAERRYETTESKFQLFQNSLENLGIAVGDSVNPALADLAESGADILGWLEDIIKANPEIAQLTIALLAAGGAFAALSVAIPAVTSAIKLLNGVLSSNPWMLAVTAIGAVVAGIITLATVSGNAKSETDALIDSLEESAEARKVASEAAQQEADGVTALATALTNLVDKEEKTATDKKLISEMVAQLNESVPELTLAYSEEADALIDLSTGAELAADSVMALAEAEARRMIDAQEYQNLVELKQEEILLADQLALAIDRLTEAQEQYNEAYEKWLASGSTEDESALNAYGREVVMAEAAVKSLTTAVDENQVAIENNTAHLEENAGKQKEVSDGNDTIQKSVDNLTTKMDALDLAYIEAYETAAKSVNGTIDLFTNLSDVGVTSIDELSASLSSQVEFMNTYSENLKRAAELGVDEGLLRILADGSVDSAAILAGIADDAGTNVDTINENFRKVTEGKTDFIAELAAIQIDFDDKSLDIQNEAAILMQKVNSSFSDVDAQPMVDQIQSVIDQIRDYNAAVFGMKSLPNMSKESDVDGSHAGGLSYVPTDGYVAELHRGEMVLTATQARAYRANESITNNTSNSSVSLGGLTVNVTGNVSRTEVNNIVDTLSKGLQQRLRIIGGVRA